MENGNGKPQTMTGNPIQPGDKYVLLVNRAGTAGLQCIVGESQSFSENLAMLIGGLQALYMIISQDPKYSPSPIIQPFAGAKKI